MDAATGEERRRLETGGEVCSTPVVADGTVYVGSEDDFLYAVHT
ncbi:PQQ-binding-like beta-propeller repeat protein [Streptomyces sp. NPDC013157]